MTLENAIQLVKIRDELEALAAVNTGVSPHETYEENVIRRARIEVRRCDLLARLGKLLGSKQ